MPELMNPLPTDHAFVLQMKASRDCACRTGRVEHLATGQAARFTTPAELWDFIDEVLTGLERPRDTFRDGRERGGNR